MSHPLKRRMAKAALVLTAGAAPVVGAGGAANAVELPQATDLGGLTSLDSAGVGDAVDETTATAGELGGEAVRSAAPAVGRMLGATGRAVTSDDTLAETGRLVGEITQADVGKTLGDLPLDSVKLG